MALVKLMGTCPLERYPVTHTFTKGLYMREIRCPAGSLIVTRILKEQHPFTLSKGVCSVWTDDRGVVQIRAPFTGITEPGTQRVIFCHTDVVWTTYHANPENMSNIEQLEARITAEADEVIDAPANRIDVIQLVTDEVLRLEDTP